MKFQDKMTKQNFKTFSNVNAKKSSGRGTVKEVVLKAEINLFGHMILAAQSRQLHVRGFLAHPLCPLPGALANSQRGGPEGGDKFIWPHDPCCSE